MRKYIRIPGLIIFVSLATLIIGGAIFFAGPLIKNIAESNLTDANGAKVDIEDVIIKWSPFTLTLKNIEVADKQNPMKNLVQIAETSFSLSIPDLFLSKVIIEEISVLGIKPDASRKTSGIIEHEAIVEKESAADGDSTEEAAFKMPDLALPDIKQLLQVEPLKSTALFKDLNTDLDNTNASWDTIDAQINDAARWKSYDDKYRQIQQGFKGNTQQKLAAIKSAKELSSELKNEGKQFNEAQSTFKSDLNRLETGFKKAKAAPVEDYQHLKNKINLDNMSPENISQMVFGPQVAEYVALARKWYARIEPYLADDEAVEETVLERSKGIDVQFKEYNPRPDYFIRLAKIEAHTPRGQFVGSVTDVSSDQSINKKPMRLLLSAKGMNDRKAEEVEAEFNYIVSGKGFTKIDYLIEQQQINDFKVSKSSSLPLVMQKSSMDMSFSSMLKDGRIDGAGRFDFSDVTFVSSNKKKLSSFNTMLVESFSEIDQFDIRPKFSGSLRDLKVGVKSNIDNQLGDQLKIKFDQKKKQYEADLKAAIAEKYKEPLAKIEAKRNKLTSIKNKVASKQNELKEKLASLKQSISSQADAQKKKLDEKKKAQQDKLKDKLKKKLKLF